MWPVVCKERGNAYKFVSDSDTGKTVLAIWRENVLFDEFAGTLKEEHWLDDWEYEKTGYYEIISDLIQEGSMSAPETFGIFVPNNSDINKVASSLQKRYKTTIAVVRTPIIVKTRNSTYRFGKADKAGLRTISRDEEPLDFSRCKILFLALGRSMDLGCLEATHPYWHTSQVLHIKS